MHDCLVLHCFYIRESVTMYVATSECPLILHSSLYFLNLDVWDLLLWRQFLTQMLQTSRQQYSSIYLPNSVKYFFLYSVDLELHKVWSLWKQTLSSEKRAFNGLEPEAILVSSLTLHLDTFFLPCFSFYTHKESRSLFKELYLLYFEQDLAYIIVFDWFKGMK